MCHIDGKPKGRGIRDSLDRVPLQPRVSVSVSSQVERSYLVRLRRRPDPCSHPPVDTEGFVDKPSPGRFRGNHPTSVRRSTRRLCKTVPDFLVDQGETPGWCLPVSYTNDRRWTTGLKSSGLPERH